MRKLRPPFQFWISLFISIAGIGIGIYVGVFHQREIKLSFTLVEQTSVVDIKHQESKLSILYDSVDLFSQNLDLQFLSIRIENNSRVHITESDYVTNAPIGIVVKGGRIADKPVVIRSSDKYFDRELTFPKVGLDTITFPKVSFDSRAYFVMKLLILHDKDSTITVSPIGKFTGVKDGDFDLSKETIQKNNLEGMLSNANWFVRMFNGGIGIQIWRTFIYGAISMLLALLFMFLIREKSKGEMPDYDRQIQRVKKKLRSRIGIDFKHNPELVIKMHTVFVNNTEAEISDRYTYLLKKGTKNHSESEKDEFFVFQEMIRRKYIQVDFDRDELIYNIIYFPELEDIFTGIIK